MDTRLKELIEACEGPGCPMPVIGRAVANFGRYFDRHVEGLTVGTDADGHACFVGECPFCGGVGTWEAEFIAGCWICRSCTREEQGFDAFLNRLSPGLMTDDEAMRQAGRFVSQAFRGPGR